MIRYTPGEYHCLKVVVMSYGQAHDHTRNLDLAEADIVISVRGHLPGPHVDPELRLLTGMDVRVRGHVLDQPGAWPLIDATANLVLAMLPNADRDGRLLRLAVSGLGGRHRSVVIANAVGEALAAHRVGVEVEHLDADKETAYQ